MAVLMQTISNKIVQAGVLSWLVAQVIKLIILSVKDKKIDWSVLLKTGNMPSSHTATVVGIASMIYILEGLSNLFFVTAFLAIIIMYDSVTLRRQVGVLSKVLNKISKKKIKKYVGHKFMEVLAGLIIGIVVAALVVLI